MTAVTFPNGNQYSDDGTTANDMRNGGFRTSLLPMIGDTITVANSAVTAAASAVPAATTATSAASTASAAAATASAAAATAVGVSLIKQPSEIAGVDPTVDFVLSSSVALPAGVMAGTSAKYVFDRTGALTSTAAGTPPIEFDAVSGALRGMRVETAATNLILGSDAPSTQTVSVTAQAYTLSFYGTGSIVLSGTYSATVTGTGAFPTQKTLTFTPTAGTLTLTISGTVQYAQLEAGSFPTSYIKTVGSTVTRTADSNIMSLSGVSGWNSAEGTAYVEADLPQTTTYPGVFQIDDGTLNNFVRIIGVANSTAVWAEIYVGGVAQATLVLGNMTPGTTFKAVVAWKANSFAGCLNGGTVATDTSGSVPTPTQIRLGSGSVVSGGHVRRLTVFPRRLPDATLALLTA
ncbi:hypothetical protein ABNQ39_20520 [Azospirillum sp. A26]|uniref:hypothetical protein n=1 Tax=Azospirillum sp. A26 TaxID=3160607 RepID=UPI00367003BA